MWINGGTEHREGKCSDVPRGFRPIDSGGATAGAAWEMHVEDLGHENPWAVFRGTVAGTERCEIPRRRR